MNIKILTTVLLTACIAGTSSSAQNLFAAYEGKTMTFRGKGVSSGKSFTIKDKVVACASSESGLCLGDRPIFNANYAIQFENENVSERIQLGVEGGKLVASFVYANPNGGVHDTVPLKVKVRK